MSALSAATKQIKFPKSAACPKNPILLEHMQGGAQGERPAVFPMEYGLNGSDFFLRQRLIPLAAREQESAQEQERE